MTVHSMNCNFTQCTTPQVKATTAHMQRPLVALLGCLCLAICTAATPVSELLERCDALSTLLGPGTAVYPAGGEDLLSL